MHVVVTGASSGIGEAIAKRFARDGVDLTIVARRRERLEALARDLDVRCHVVVQDLAELDAATAWLPEAERSLGPVDVLVNNAGVQMVGPTSEIDVARGEQSLRLNLFVPLRLTKALLPAMVARGDGCIVDVVSMAALAPTPGMTYYNAGKAGLAAASEALRGELRGTGVHVVTVYPGIIPTTDMGQQGLAAYHESRALALQPTGTPERLADLVAEAVRRRQARVIYPRSNTLARWFPATTRWVLDRLTPDLR